MSDPTPEEQILIDMGLMDEETFNKEHELTESEIKQHVSEIVAWIAETMDDRGEGLNMEEVAYDTVSSYIAAYVSGGENSTAAQQIRRAMFGE